MSGILSLTGAQFERNEDGSLAYTKEGAHSTNRIIFHEDVTGKEITSTLLREVQKLSNVELLEYTTLVDTSGKRQPLLRRCDPPSRWFP